MKAVTRWSIALGALVFAAACRDESTTPTSPGATRSSSVGNVADQGQGRGPDQGVEVLDRAIIHRTVEAVAAAGKGGKPGGGSSNPNLYYHGGVGGIGVEDAPKVYLVLWGSQWNGGDPSGESALLQSFYGDVGGSSWLNSVTQYCQGVATNAYSCPAGSDFAGNQTGIIAGVWYDNGAAAPSRPKQSQIAAEAVAAAQHFGNTTAASNSSVQYVIATATHNNSSGFGTQYCAYHSSTSSTVGTVAYTNLPYITDAGSSCGANFQGLGANAGITIVGGHELAETISDQFPNGGWLDSGGAENGDKCAWSTSSGFVTLSGNISYAVQPLWSNASNNGAGACVMNY